MQRGLFITGTDTGVGKTYIAAGLIRAMKDQGINVCPMKPVETGCRIRGKQLVPADAMRLVASSGIDEKIDLINPYRFRKPLAPLAAAELEGVTIRKKNIIVSFNALSKKYDFIVTEGAGGIMVPLTKKYRFIDLICELGQPIVIVARPGLGTLNHTLLTIEAARNRGINVLGVIISYAQKGKKGLSEKTNPSVIEQTGGVPVIGIIPHIAKSDHESAIALFKQTAQKIRTLL